MDVLVDGAFKSYMDKSKTKDKTSKAYKLLSKAQNKNGLYYIGDYVCVAMSDYYGQIGDKFRITLENDTFYAIKSETKKSKELKKHAHPDGSVIEFVVKESDLPRHIVKAGSLDSIFNGKIEKIERMK